MAAEALGMHLYAMEQDGDILPDASIPPFEEMPVGGIVMPITIYPRRFKPHYGKCMTVTDPSLTKTT